MKKRYLLFIPLLFVLFSFKNANAVTASSYVLYKMDYGEVSRGSFGGNSGEWISVAGTGTARVRLYFNQSFTKGCSYQLSLKEGYSTLNSYWSSSLGLYNLYVNEQIGSLSSPVWGSEQTAIEGGATYRRQGVLTFNYVPNASGSNTFWEFQFSNQPLRVLYMMTPTLEVLSSDCSSLSTGGATNKDIIDNQNKNTQDLINNQNKNTQDIKDNQDKNTDKINDTLTDDDTSGAEDSANTFFDNFSDEDYGLSDVITMPLQFINGLANNSCNSLEFPLPFVDKDVSIPCMTSIYEKYFGSFLNLYQIITTGFISYWVCINIFSLVQGFKNPDDDKVEVMDL